ncbi:leucine-rich repeat protein kinase family protein [Striga asiatica]|uniref:Leucine-rich repeat protein kinase family protein n=1 Tax=Striga asiatica TaxID=4170 RepID=A0A5A7PK80_STRAF|nr:leucine-rich repeat protein kinase family protein [Striga asiatica]
MSGQFFARWIQAYRECWLNSGLQGNRLRPLLTKMDARRSVVCKASLSEFGKSKLSFLSKTSCEKNCEKNHPDQRNVDPSLKCIEPAAIVCAVGSVIGSEFSIADIHRSEFDQQTVNAHYAEFLHLRDSTAYHGPDRAYNLRRFDAFERRVDIPLVRMILETQEVFERKEGFDFPNSLREALHTTPLLASILKRSESIALQLTVASQHSLYALYAGSIGRKTVPTYLCVDRLWDAS